MSKILIAWELGAGLGHLLPMRALGTALTRRGHRVIAVLRETHLAPTVLAGTGVEWVRGPEATRKVTGRMEATRGYGHLLAHIGFGFPEQLAVQFAAWDQLFREYSPDLVVADHAPTALLALRGRPICTVNLGLGFYCPPDTFPLPFWRHGDADTRKRVIDEELVLVENANGVLRPHRRPALQRLGQLFGQINDVMITTYKEFDPFSRQTVPRYWGHWHAQGGALPQWPAGNGPRIFAYLKPFPALHALLEALKSLGLPTIFLAGEMAGAFREAHASPTIRFESDPLDMGLIAQQCDLGITNAGHGVLASLLLAGKPVLLFPLFLEQLFNARATAKLGAGAFLSPEASSEVDATLSRLLGTSVFRENAQAFANRYLPFMPGQQLSEIIDHLEKLIADKS